MTSTTDFYTLPPSKHHEAHDGGVQKQLRALNNEYRDTQEALNHTQASLNRAMKLMEENYQRKRRAIINGNGPTHNDAE